MNKKKRLPDSSGYFDGVLEKLLNTALEENRAALDQLPPDQPLVLSEVEFENCRYVLLVECPSVKDRLTPRERQICALVRQGYSNKEIARALTISTFTVATHLRNIYSKLEIHSRAVLAGQTLTGLGKS